MTSKFTQAFEGVQLNVQQDLGNKKYKNLVHEFDVQDCKVFVITSGCYVPNSQYVYQRGDVLAMFSNKHYSRTEIQSVVSKVKVLEKMLVRTK